MHTNYGRRFQPHSCRRRQLPATLKYLFFSTQLLYSSYCPSLGPKSDSECGTVGKGQQSRPNQLGFWKCAVNFPAGFGARLDCQNFLTIYSTQDVLSWHYIIVNVDYAAIGGKTPVLPLCVRPHQAYRLTILLLDYISRVSTSRRHPYSSSILCLYFMRINIHIANPFSYDQAFLHYHIECGLRKLLSN